MLAARRVRCDLVSPSPAPDPSPPAVPRAQVVLLAGPSGSGKSHLAARCSLPVVCLDDFYKDGDDPSLPIGELGIDWDDAAAWDAERALAALTELVTVGVTDLPIYDISRDRATGTHRIALDGAPLVVAEGIFAAELIARCRGAGILAEALCLTHRPIVTFWRRLVRDLREGRKAPWLLVRRGLALRRQEPDIVARHILLGATPIHGHDAIARIARLAAERRDDPDQLAA
jgi:uridine kinase